MKKFLNKAIPISGVSALALGVLALMFLILRVPHSIIIGTVCAMGIFGMSELLMIIINIAIDE